MDSSPDLKQNVESAFENLRDAILSWTVISGQPSVLILRAPKTESQEPITLRAKNGEMLLEEQVPQTDEELMKVLMTEDPLKQVVKS